MYASCAVPGAEAGRLIQNAALSRGCHFVACANGGSNQRFLRQMTCENARDLIYDFLEEIHMAKIVYPEMIVHYYEASQGPFRSLSDLPLQEAESILQRIRQEGIAFASQRSTDYLDIRKSLEERIRRLFIEKGGQPKRLRPHYFILGHCDWVKSWYCDGQEVQVLLKTVNPHVISFTYGDSFPAMRYQDGKPYRGQVYILEELPALLAQYGLPQVWNPEGKSGPERYIEAQVWDNEPVRGYLGKQGS
jgi:hypothetical protein